MPLLLPESATPAPPVLECGEALVPVPRGVAAEGARPLVRSGLAARLAVAGLLLPPGRRLLVVAGHRSPSRPEAVGRHRAGDVHEEAHAAGAAVDVTLIDRLGRAVDLGDPVEAMDDAADEGRLDPRVSADARLERRLLADALAGAGLVQQPGAWWHWSHGDRSWARATRSPSARYGPIER